MSAEEVRNEAGGEGKVLLLWVAKVDEATQSWNRLNVGRQTGTAKTVPLHPIPCSGSMGMEEGVEMADRLLHGGEEVAGLKMIPRIPDNLAVHP